MTNRTVEEKALQTTEKPASSQRFRSTQFPPVTDSGPSRSKSSHAKEILQMVSMSVPVIGFAGTLFVWCAANLYVGDVEIITDRQCPDMVVNVFNQKGQSTSYRINKFQLMPGEYRVEVSPDGRNKTVSDITVQFHSLNRILVTVPRGFGASRVAPSMVPRLEQAAAAQTGQQPDASKVLQQVPGPANGPSRPGEQEDSALQLTEPETQTAQQARTTGGPTPITDGETHPIRQPDSAASDTDTDNGSDKKRWWQVWHKKSDN